MNSNRCLGLRFLLSSNVRLRPIRFQGCRPDELRLADRTFVHDSSLRLFRPAAVSLFPVELWRLGHWRCGFFFNDPERYCILIFHGCAVGTRSDHIDESIVILLHNHWLYWRSWFGLRNGRGWRVVGSPILSHSVVLRLRGRLTLRQKLTQLWFLFLLVLDHFPHLLVFSPFEHQFPRRRHRVSHLLHFLLHIRERKDILN